MSLIDKNAYDPDAKELRLEVLLTKENAITTRLNPTSKLKQLLGRMIWSASLKQDDSTLKSDISSYLAEEFKRGGFDGWSNGYLDLLRIKRVARILDMDAITAELKPLEFAAKGGSLCGGASDDNKVGLIKCLP